MLSNKNIRQRGKIRLSEYFKILRNNDRVAVFRELSQMASFPKRIQGKTGMIERKSGNSYIIKLLDGEKMKSFSIHPVHLKKIQGQNDK